MDRILQILAVMAGLALVGVALRRFRILRPEHAPGLNRVALEVTLPAAIFASIHDYDIGGEAVAPAGVFFVQTLLVWLLAERMARLLRLEAGARATFVIAAVFGNIIYIGYPLAAALYGEQGLAQAVLVDQLGLEPLAFTLGPLVAARGGAEQVAWRGQLVGLLRFPPLLAVTAGLAWNLAGAPAWPSWAQTVLSGAGLLTVPLVMIAYGLVVRSGALRAVWREAVAVSVIRLVLAPLVTLGLAAWLGLEAWRSAVVVLQAATPTMMFTLVLATRYGLDVERSAAFITATMLASAVTLPLWAAVVG